MFKFLVRFLVLVSGIGIGVAQTNDATLGALIAPSGSIFTSETNTLALLPIKQPIKVTIAEKAFTKSTFKDFKRQVKPNVSINYVDSLKTKPSYLKITIADKLNLLNTINHKGNAALRDLLSTNSNIALVTSIAIAFNKKELNTLLQAEEVFLEVYGKQSTALVVYTKGKKTAIIPFSKGCIFEYDSSHFCWQEDKGKPKIVTVTARKRCPKDTHGSADKTKTKINYYKF